MKFTIRSIGNLQMPLVVLLFALFASLFTIEKNALHYAQPFFLVGSRMMLAGILLLGWQSIRDSSNLKISSSAWKSIGLLAFINIYLTNTLEIWGLSHMASSKTCLLYSLSPFFAALVAYFVLNEKLNTRKWMGLIVGFVGLWPILYTQTENEWQTGQWMIFSIAECAVLGAVVSSVFGWILLKKIIAEHAHLTLLTINGYSMLIGGCLAMTQSYTAGEHWAPIPVYHFGYYLLFIAALCITSNLICYNLYGYLLRKYSATFISFAGLLTPMFSTFYGWYFLDEVITWHFYTSIAIFSIGMIFFFFEEAKDTKTNQSKTYKLTKQLGA